MAGTWCIVEPVAALRSIMEGGAPAPAPKPQPNAGPTFGKVPHPPFLDRPIYKPEGQGWNDLGPRSPKGVVLHRMIGSLWGTDGYFRQAGVNALTDYGVGVSAKDGAAKDGETIRWNDPVGRRAGWASGPVSAPYGDGAAFVAKYGANAVNRDLVSIEISGDYPTPLSPRAFEAICGIAAYWADRMRVPWSSFPINPATGISFVYWHQEFTLGTGKICPGPVVIDATTRVIERARAILRTHQTGGVGPAPTPSPVPPKETLLSRVRLPEGVTVADLREWFGKGLDEDGPVSVAWAEEAARTGQYPELVRFDPPGEQRDFRFASGLVVRYEDGEARVLRLTSGLDS